MINLESILFLIVAYLLGSMPTSVIIGKKFYGIDIREYGSGNAGATNTFRILGKKAGIPVLIIDILKGFSATSLVLFITTLVPSTEQFVNTQLAYGIAAILGHLFPVFAGFRGGKGIATLLGMVLAVHPPAAGICILIFIVILLITKYVSLGSILGSVAFPFLIVFVYHTTIKSLIIFGIAIAILVILTHQKNIERLLRGEESKANLFKKKSV
ncbi:MAG: glycerol-3-phosphate acyltransferase PlsY [Sphingobacteriales bacterium]